MGDNKSNFLRVFQDFRWRFVPGSMRQAGSELSKQRHMYHCLTESNAFKQPLLWTNPVWALRMRTNHGYYCAIHPRRDMRDLCFAVEENSMYLYDYARPLHYCSLVKFLFVLWSYGFLHVSVTRLTTDLSENKKGCKVVLKCHITGKCGLMKRLWSSLRPSLSQIWWWLRHCGDLLD